MKCPGDDKGFDKEFKTITYFRSCVSIQAIYDFLAMFPNATITLKYKLCPLIKIIPCGTQTYVQ